MTTKEKDKHAPFDYGATLPNGQHEHYPVLPEADRAKGFIRPLRRTYVHAGVPGSTHQDHVNRQLGRDAPEGSGCGVATTMTQALAETYARDPSYYAATFCVGCGTHRPVEEFVWDGTQERVGS